MDDGEKLCAGKTTGKGAVSKSEQRRRAGRSELPNKAVKSS